VMQYTGAHGAFFEAALEGWPTLVLEWLAQGLPRLKDVVPHNDGGMLLKDSIEWKRIVNNAQPELLPDYCFHCDTIWGHIPGGQIREGCPNCIENFPADYDSRLSPLMRIGFVLEAATDNDYFDTLVSYLFCCHIAWRQTAQWNPKPEPAKRSLLEKL